MANYSGINAKYPPFICLLAQYSFFLVASSHATPCRNLINVQPFTDRDFFHGSCTIRLKFM